MALEYALEADQLAVGAHARVDLGGQPLLLSHLEDGFHAVHDTCLHRGASLSVGQVENGIVSCHLHFWNFDVRTGVCLQVPGIQLKVFPVTVKEGKVYVEV